MESLLVFPVVIWLAYANGSNDSFKGVATLFGSGVSGYRGALSWAVLTTLAGSLAAMGLAGGLVRTFSGQGIVPDAIAQSPSFALAVVAGAAATVMLASRVGLPISTTHALVGALIGAGVAGAGTHVSYTSLAHRVIAPLILSPVIALCLTAILYLIARRGQGALGLERESCVCVGEEEWVGGPPAGTAVRGITARVDASAGCASRYRGRLLAIDVRTSLDRLHYLSAGAVSFARGLNDTPKIAALLLMGGHLARPASITSVAVAFAMAVGGLLSARRVAETMSHRVTPLAPGEGLAANLVTAALVTTASFNGLPVSTTQVSVGSIAGIGTVTGQTRWKVLLSIGAAWIGTLPVAAALAALTFLIIAR